jgi:hypothetical protein
LTQRIALAPALLVIAVGVHLVDRPHRFATAIRRALVLVLILSAVQILRSAVLYVTAA